MEHASRDRVKKCYPIWRFRRTASFANARCKTHDASEWIAKVESPYFTGFLRGPARVAVGAGGAATLLGPRRSSERGEKTCKIRLFLHQPIAGPKLSPRANFAVSFAKPRGVENAI